MTTTTNAAAEPVLTQYTRAMCRGDLDACIRIERHYDLFGYPPEVVSVGLKAIDEGRDMQVAVNAYIGDGDD